MTQHQACWYVVPGLYHCCPIPLPHHCFLRSSGLRWYTTPRNMPLAVFSWTPGAFITWRINPNINSIFYSWLVLLFSLCSTPRWYSKRLTSLDGILCCLCQHPIFWYFTGIEVIWNQRRNTRYRSAQVSTIDRLGAINISPHTAWVAFAYIISTM